MKRKVEHLRALVHGLVTDVPGCPACTSADVRPSRKPAAATAVGLKHYRCRACGELFWLRESQVPAVQEIREKFLRGPDAADPKPQWVTRKGTKPAPLPDFDLSATPTPLSEADLTDLDRVIEREDDEEAED